jgi:uncharacterized protein YciI
VLADIMLYFLRNNTFRYVPDILQKRGPYREAHLAGANKKLEAGQLVMAGGRRKAAAAAAAAQLFSWWQQHRCSPAKVSSCEA